MFNFLSVLVLLPLEVITQYLYRITKLMLPASLGDGGETWDSPFQTMLDPIMNNLIISNSNLMKDVANGDTTCPAIYPIYCENGIETYDNCKAVEGDPERTGFGLIACDKTTNKCPSFFQIGATQSEDMVSAGFCLLLGITILIIALIGLVICLKKLLLGVSVRIIHKAVSMNGYLGMAIGCLITMLVQSSSVTTSTLTPLVGIGVLPLEQVSVQEVSKKVSAQDDFHVAYAYSLASARFQF